MQQIPSIIGQNLALQYPARVFVDLYPLNYLLRLIPVPCRHVKAAGGRVIEVLTHLPLVARAFWVYIQDIDIPKRGHLLRDYEPVP